MKAVWKTWKKKRGDSRQDASSTTPYTYDPFSGTSADPDQPQPFAPAACDARFYSGGSARSSIDSRLTKRSRSIANISPSTIDADAQNLATYRPGVPSPPSLRSIRSGSPVPTKSSRHRPQPLKLVSPSSSVDFACSSSDNPRSQPTSPRRSETPRSPPRSPRQESRFSPSRRDFAPGRAHNGGQPRIPSPHALPIPIEPERGHDSSGSGRAMPELDGVWAVFLQEVNEDCDSVASSLEERTIDPALRPPHVSVPKIQTPSRPKLATSRSTPSLPRYDSSPAPRDGNEILLEFPPVPPLNIVNRDRAPKLKRSYNSYNSYNSSGTSTPPLSPASTRTQDATPVATPITPKFPHATATPHIARQSSKSSSRDYTHSPTGLYPAMSSSGSSFLSSGSSRPTTPPSPRSMSRHPHAHGPGKPLRPTHSCAQLRPTPVAKIHRATSSDSASEHSDAPHSSPRPRGALAHPKHVDAVLASNPDYLRSRGRLPSLSNPTDSQRKAAAVRYGYAI